MKSADNTLTVHLLTEKWSSNLHFFDEIDSTNRYLLEHEADLAPFTVAVTDFQSAGRGRLQRRWIAPPRTSLLVSVLLWPSFPPFWLTMIAGLSAVEAVERHADVTVGLKWPNDVMVRSTEGKWHKLGGILTEVRSADERVTAVVGMGLNVNIAAADLPDAATPAASLLTATGQRIPREPLLDDWLTAFERNVLSAERGDSPHRRWSQRLITLGQRVQVSGGAGAVFGVATGTDEWGQLLVRDDAGRLHEVAAGDVTLRGSAETKNG